ncbi:hypothetical protein K1X76_06235 [bacterium]|nr:hypothetical protein [bacterium]
MQHKFVLFLAFFSLVSTTGAYADDTGFFTAQNLSDQFQNRISVGNAHSCFIKDDGVASCWGKNDFMSLGDSSYTQSYSARPRLVPLYDNSESYVSITAGFSHTCAVTSNGHGRCWGYDAYGNNGNGFKNTLYNGKKFINADTAKPVVYSFENNGITQNIELTDILQLGAGKNHNCAVLHNGAVECWGNASNWELGNNDSGTNKNYAVAVLGYHGPGVNLPNPECANTCNQSCVMPNYMGLMVAGTNMNTCLVRLDNKIECWGTESSDAPVNGNDTYSDAVHYPQSRFVLDSITKTPLEKAFYVAASSFHVCSVVDDDIPGDNVGSVYCWGTNDNSQLGDNTKTDQIMAVKVAGISNATMVDCGEKFSCAVTTDGEVKCWGSQIVGRMGNGVSSEAVQFVPSAVKTDAQTNLSNAVEVSLGFAHACAYTNNNGVSDVYCWGQNTSGQLGNGSTANSLYAKKVAF